MQDNEQTGTDIVLRLTLIRRATGSALTFSPHIELRNLEYVVLTHFPGWEVEAIDTDRR